jgi:hypothetical protein
MKIQGMVWFLIGIVIPRRATKGAGMKKNIMSLVVMGALGASIAISSATIAAADDVGPTVKNCTCKVWSTFIEDCAYWMDKGMIKEGAHPTQFYHEASKVMAEKEREAYLNGLINAYGAVYSLTKKEMYNLPYCVGQYELELDAYAHDPKNADVPISAAILIVNSQIGRKVPRQSTREGQIPRY